MRVFRLLYAFDELAPERPAPSVVFASTGRTLADPHVPRYSFVNGTRFDAGAGFNIVCHTQGAETDVVFPMVDTVPCFREHVRDLIESLDPGAVQWLRTPFIGREREDWWCANVLHHYGCLDEERSTLEWHKDEHGRPDRIRSPMGIYDAVLVASKIGPRALFRLDRYRWWLCCHESVYDACRACGVTGLAFQELTVA